MIGGWRHSCCSDAELNGQQFGNSDQSVCEQIEQEGGSDASDAAMLGLAHGAVLLAPAEDAFGHRPARLRHALALVACAASVNGFAGRLSDFSAPFSKRKQQKH